MSRVALLDSEGAVVRQVDIGRHRTAATAGMNPDGLREVRVARFGRPGEVIEPGTGGWRDDREAREQVIDASFLADHGPLAIALSHQLKALEARCIVAGLPIAGIVAAEAEIRGVPVEELARSIVERADEALAPELARITAKVRG